MRKEIELVGVSKSFQSSRGLVPALRDVSFGVESGSFVCLVGPSGCGKSTLLRCIAGLEQPDAGHVLIDEIDVTNQPPELRNLEWLPQRVASTFLRNKSISYNLAIGLRTRHVPEHEQKISIDRVSSVVGIGHLLNRFPPELSGGELQRVALARAIIRECNIFLLDEPLTSLDEARRREMRRELKALHDAAERTFVYVTHDQREALSLGTICVVMNEGAIAQVGSPHNVFFSPQSLFVARFFSQNGLNEFSCQAVLDANGWRFSSAYFDFSMAATVQRLGFIRSATLAIRPEDLFFGNVEGSGNFVPFGRCSVIDRTFFGNESFVTVTMNSANNAQVIAKNVDSVDENEGWLNVRTDRLFAFDGASENALDL